MTKTSASTKIDASGIYYRDLNTQIRQLATDGVKKFKLENVFGQRYIGTNLDNQIEIEVYGTPGNDLGAFMNGSSIVVHGNAQDGCGNTMNDGEIIVQYAHQYGPNARLMNAYCSYSTPLYHAMKNSIEYA